MRYQFSEQQISDAVKNNTSAAGTLRTLGMRAAGGNFKTLYSKISLYNIDNSHWRGKDNFIPGTWVQNVNKKSLEEILVENSEYKRTGLKIRLLKENLLENKCYKCGQLPVWNGLPLVLQLDHINGVYNDNRIENLRMLCPNCHTQTDTFAGKKTKLLDKFCECGKKMARNSTTCFECNKKKINKKDKFNWPPIEEMIEFLKINSFSAYARKLNVSDVAIHKHIRKNGYDPKLIGRLKYFKETRYCYLCNKELCKTNKNGLCLKCTNVKLCAEMREKKKLKNLAPGDGNAPPTSISKTDV